MKYSAITTNRKKRNGNRKKRAIPSGNSVGAYVLLVVGRLTMDERLVRAGERTIGHFSGHLSRMPTGFPFLMLALDLAVGPAREIVLAGETGDETLAAMSAEVRRRFLPRTVTAVHLAGEPGEDEVGRRISGRPPARTSADGDSVGALAQARGDDSGSSRLRCEPARQLTGRPRGTRTGRTGAAARGTGGRGAPGAASSLPPGPDPWPGEATS